MNRNHVKTIGFFFLSSILFSTIGMTQIPDYIFRTLAIDGKVKLNRRELKPEMKLDEQSDVVKVAENSAVKLMHWTGKTLRIHNAGEYTILDLLNELNRSSKPNRFVFKVLEFNGDIEVNDEKLHSGIFLFESDSIEVKDKASMSIIHESGKIRDITTPGKYAMKDLLEMKTDDYLKKVKISERPKSIPPKESYLINVIDGHPMKFIFSPVTFFWCVNDSVKRPNGFVFKVTLTNMVDDKIKSYITTENLISVNMADDSVLTEDIVLLAIELLNKETIVTKSRRIVLKPLHYPELEAKLASSSEDYHFWNAVAEECIQKGFYFNGLHALFKAYRISGNEEDNKKVYQLIADKFDPDGDLKCFD